MVRGDLDAGHVLVVGQIDHFLGRRDMQHVDALAGLARQVHQAGGAAHCHFGRAPDRVARRIAGHAQVLALFEHIFVFRMEGGAAGNGAQDGLDAGIVLHQQRAGGGAHEDLDAGAAGQLFQFGQLADIFMRAADIEGEVAMHAAGAGGDLGLEGLPAGGQRIGIGHFEDAGDAAHHGRERAGFQIFLMRQAGLAEMDLGIDDAGQDMQALAVDDFGGAVAGQIAQGGDAARGDADIGTAFTVMVDQRRVLENRVVLRHVCGPVVPRTAPV